MKRAVRAMRRSHRRFTLFLARPSMRGHDKQLKQIKQVRKQRSIEERRGK